MISHERVSSIRGRPVKTGGYKVLPDAVRRTLEKRLFSSIVEVERSPTVDTETLALRVRLSDGRIVRASLHPSEDRRTAFRIMGHLFRHSFASGSFRIPRPLLYDPAQNALVYEEAAGAPLRSLLETSGDYWVRRAGAGLKKLHALPTPRGLRRIDVGDFFLPPTNTKDPVLKAIGEAAQPVVPLFGPLPFTHLVHGDPNPDNFLVDGRSRIVTLIDFTDSGIGDAAMDVGIFLMYLAVAGAKRLASSFFAGYGIDRVDRDRIRAWTALAFLHNALYIASWLPAGHRSRSKLVLERIAQARRALENR